MQNNKNCFFWLSDQRCFFRLKTNIWYASLITIVQEIIQGTDNDCLLAVGTAGDRSSAKIFLICLFVWSPAVEKKLSQKLKPSSKYIWVQPISLIGADWRQFGARLSKKVQWKVVYILPKRQQPHSSPDSKYLFNVAGGNSLANLNG